MSKEQEFYAATSKVVSALKEFQNFVKEDLVILEMDVEEDDGFMDYILLSNILEGFETLPAPMKFWDDWEEEKD